MISNKGGFIPMNKFKFDNISGCSWEVKNPKAVIVISHGMAEHAERYDYFAKKLNDQEYSVYAINQIGHGDAIVDGLKGHWEKGDFYHCVDNLKVLVDHVKKEFKGPVFLFGHSMGSFISQEYIKRYGNTLNGCILSGSAKTGLLHKMGNLLAGLSTKPLKEPNKFLDSLSFGSYNGKIENPRTKFDWLSRDEKQVDKYVADDLCGYCCTTGFFKNFMKGLANLNKNVKDVPVNLPIYLMAGHDDPVGTYGKDVLALEKMYKDYKIKDVSCKLYDGGRHEMLNEINKDEVIADVVAWFKKHI